MALVHMLHGIQVPIRGCRISQFLLYENERVHEVLLLFVLKQRFRSDFAYRQILLYSLI